MCMHYYYTRLTWILIIYHHSQHDFLVLPVWTVYLFWISGLNISSPGLSLKWVKCLLIPLSWLRLEILGSFLPSVVLMILSLSCTVSSEILKVSPITRHATFLFLCFCYYWRLPTRTSAPLQALRALGSQSHTPPLHVNPRW